MTRTVQAGPIGGSEIQATFDRIAGEYLAGYEISMTFPAGPLTASVYADPLAVGVDGYVDALRCGADVSLDGSARVIRAALLARAEDMADAFAAEGWLHESAPRFDFGGSLHHAESRCGGVSWKPPQEYGIGLRVRLSLVHLDVEEAP